MFSKIFPWAFFFNWMPYPRRFILLGPRFVLWYGSYYEQYKKATIRYYKVELRNLDQGSRIRQNLDKLNLLRKEAQEQGIDQRDPVYPHYNDVAP